MAEKDGKPAPALLWADKGFADIRIPDGVSVAQIARVLVKWLREHPERLHETKNLLVMDALNDGFPAQGQGEKEAVKPLAKPR